MHTTSAKELNKIPLGSADVYLMKYTGTIPKDSEIEKDENMIGRVKNGVSISYTTESYKAKSDDGKAVKTKIVSEDAYAEWSYITWNGRTLKVLLATATMDGTTSSGKRTVKIGGLQYDDGVSYVLRLVHTDRITGDIRITMVGKNVAGWMAAFKPNQETLVNAKFEAEPLDQNGTLIVYEEEILEEDTAVAALASKAGGFPAYSPEASETADSEDPSDFGV